MKIAEQLKKISIRFIKLNSDTKLPIELGWTLCEEDWDRQKDGSWKNKQDNRLHSVTIKDNKQIYTSKKHNYKYDDLEFQTWINQGNSFGILCGLASNGLIVIDADNPELVEHIKNNLPQTFKEHKDAHVYYWCPEIKKELPLNKNEIHFGEIKSTGRQVKVYEDNNGCEIATISREEIFDKLKDFLSVDKNFERSVESNPKPHLLFKDSIPCQAVQNMINVGVKKDSRNPTANKIIQQLRGYCGYDKMRCLESLKLFNQNCIPPKDVSVIKSDLNSQFDNYGYLTMNCKTYSNFCPFKDNISECPKSQILMCESKKHIKPETIHIGLPKEVKEEIKNKLKKGDNNKEDVKKIGDIFTTKKQIKDFGDLQPFFYDNQKNWWLWNNNKFCWEKKDEIDLLNMIEDNTQQNTISVKNRQEIINALKGQGRRNIPSEISSEWLQFKSTLVNYKTGDTKIAVPQYFVTNPIPWELSKNDSTPKLDEIFKEWIFKEGVQDISYVKTLKEIMSYCLLTHMPIQRIFALLGSGSNGKGTFKKVIKKFLGRANVCSTTIPKICNNDFELSKLYKKLTVFIDEIDKKIFEKTATLKLISGDDLAPIEFKRKAGFDAELYATPITSCNKLPDTTDKTRGFYRRWCIVDFPNEFDETRDVLADIPDEEYENFAKQSVGILKELIKKGTFTNEGSIDDRQAKYERRSNSISEFIDDYCLVDINNHMTLSNFVNNYNNWIKNSNGRMLSSKEISKRLRKDPYNYDVEVKTIGGITTTYILGVCLAENDTEYV